MFLNRWRFVGLWSQIKRAPKVSKKRNTFETDGPKKAGADSLDKRARQIFLYMKKYNYEVKETGETITFQGTYQASRAQAAALVFYVFCGEPNLTRTSQGEIFLPKPKASCAWIKLCLFTCRATGVRGTLL